jgi:hypothetical protein
MKNIIFDILKVVFRKQFIAFCLSNFPLQLTNQYEKFYLIKIKKGKIRQLRLYDKNFKRIHAGSENQFLKYSK